jgi:F-type H+-transporting ATPase subunit epsilon
MIPSTLSLVITTPLQVVVKSDRVTSFRAEDESGAFGVLPGHVDLLSVLKSCVVRWRETDDKWRYCALHGGVLSVSDGKIIRIACREGVTGPDLPSLELQVSQHREAESEAASHARVSQARLHAQAIRQIMRHLSSDHGVSVETALDEIFQ